MLKKWHKSILIEKIDRDNISLAMEKFIDRIESEFNKPGIEEFKGPIEEIGLDFDVLTSELDKVEIDRDSIVLDEELVKKKKVEEELSKDQIIDSIAEKMLFEEKFKLATQTLLEALPKLQEVKHVKRDFAMFELWNMIASKLNPKHNPIKYAKDKDFKLVEELEIEWKSEKISRLATTRQRLLAEREERRKALLKRRRSKAITKDEEKELEYMAEYDKYQDALFQESQKLDDGLGLDSSIDLDHLDQLEDSMGGIDLNADFSDFNAPEENGAFGEMLENAEIESGDGPKSKVEKIDDPIQDGSKTQGANSETSGNKKSAPQPKVKVEKTVEKKLVEKYVTDPKLIEKIESQRKHINEVLEKHRQHIQAAENKQKELLAENQERISKMHEATREMIESEKEIYEAEKNDLQVIIDDANEEIDYLNGQIEKEELKAQELISKKEALELAETYETLKGYKITKLRELADKLTLVYNKSIKKKDLIELLMNSADKLKLKYNTIEFNEAVEKRIEMLKNQVGTTELSVDPYANMNSFDSGGDNSFNMDADPFAGLLDNNGMDDPFGGGSDPFANVDTTGGMDDAFSSGDDPFGNVDTSGGMDDAFAAGDDPFGNVDASGGMDDAFSGGSDPFGNIDNSDSGMDDSFSGGSDPFGNVSNDNTMGESSFGYGQSNDPLANMGEEIPNESPKDRKRRIKLEEELAKLRAKYK